MMVVLRDFKAKSKSWYTNGSINFEGSKVDVLESSLGFHRITNKPDVQVHASFHRQLPHVKSNLNVFYPSPYEREEWFYKLTNSDCIQKVKSNFDWEKVISQYRC